MHWPSGVSSPTITDADDNPLKTTQHLVVFSAKCSIFVLFMEDVVAAAVIVVMNTACLRFWFL